MQCKSKGLLLLVFLGTFTVDLSPLPHMAENEMWYLPNCHGKMHSTTNAAFLHF
jgi:hypothetical protein